MGRNSAPRSPCEPVRVWDPIRVPCAPGKHLPGMEIKEEMLMKNVLWRFCCALSW